MFPLQNFLAKHTFLHVKKRPLTSLHSLSTSISYSFASVEELKPPSTSSSSPLSIDQIANSTFLTSPLFLKALAKEHTKHYQTMINSLNLPSSLTKDLKNETTFQLRIFYHQAKAYQDEDDDSRALVCYNKALAKAKNKKITDTIEVACINNGLGSIYINWDNMDEAEKYLSEASRIFALHSNEVGIKNPILHNTGMMAIVYNNREQLDKSFELFTQFLKESQQMPDTFIDDFFKIKVYESLGYLHFKKGEYDRAIGWYKKAIRIANMKYTENPMRGISIFEKLITALKNGGLLSETISYAEKMLTVNEKCLGKTNMKLIDNLTLLSDLYLQQGSYKKAIEVNKRISKLLQNDVLANKEQLRGIYKMIITLSMRLSQVLQARKAFDEAIAILGKVCGENSQELAEYYTFWATLLYAYKIEMDEVKIYYKKALDIYAKLDNKDDLMLIISEKLADIYKKDKNYEEAIKLYEDCIRVYIPLPDKLEKVGSLHTTSGFTKLHSRDLDGAINSFEEALKICQASSNPNKRLDICYRDLGIFYEVKGDLVHSLENYRKANELSTKINGANHKETKEYLKRCLRVRSKIEQAQFKKKEA